MKNMKKWAVAAWLGFLALTFTVPAILANEEQGRHDDLPVIETAPHEREIRPNNDFSDKVEEILASAELG